MSLSVTKTFYNSENKQASTWVREPTKGLKGVDAPQMTSGLNVAQKAAQGTDNTCLHRAIFALNSEGNSPQNSSTKVALMSACSAANAHISVIPGESFRRATALFAARKLVTGTWINDKDEYLRPYED